MTGFMASTRPRPTWAEARLIASSGLSGCSEARAPRRSIAHFHRDRAIGVVLDLLEPGQSADHPGQVTPGRGGLRPGGEVRLELAQGLLQVLPRLGPAVRHGQEELAELGEDLRAIVLEADLTCVGGGQGVEAAQGLLVLPGRDVGEAEQAVDLGDVLLGLRGFRASSRSMPGRSLAFS